MPLIRDRHWERDVAAPFIDSMPIRWGGCGRRRAGRRPVTFAINPGIMPSGLRRCWHGPNKDTDRDHKKQRAKVSVD